jgi:hypothetical protein
MNQELISAIDAAQHEISVVGQDRYMHRQEDGEYTDGDVIFCLPPHHRGEAPEKIRYRKTQLEVHAAGLYFRHTEYLVELKPGSWECWPDGLGVYPVGEPPEDFDNLLIIGCDETGIDRVTARQAFCQVFP